MFLLIRKISPYTHHDLIIGIFDNEQRALDAKSLYIQQCLINDHWADQAYTEVCLETDLFITPIEQTRYNNNTEFPPNFFVASRFDEGFGQIIRELDHFYTDEKDAIDYIAIKNKEDDNSDFPYYYDYEVVATNTIHYHEQSEDI